MADDDLNLTPEEKEELQKYLNSYGAPQPDPKHNVHTFLDMIAKAKDTTKLGNLKPEELGFMGHTARAYKTAALISKEIIGSQDISDYYAKKAEIMTSTSLSKEGFLSRLAVVTKKESTVADLTPERKENKGWFRKKDNNDTSSMSA